MGTREAHYHLDGRVNSKKNIYWGSTRPTEVSQKPLHCKKVTAWVGMFSGGIIEPFFVVEENGATATLSCTSGCWRGSTQSSRPAIQVI